MSDLHFQEQGHIFSSPGKTQYDIIKAGEKALICLYNGKVADTLDQLLYQRFCERVSSCATSVQIQSLPPTSAAGKYHSLRVYLQVQEWISLSAVLQIEQWGWKLHFDHLKPHMTDLPPAPDTLLKAIRCKCKTDYNSKRCTCRRHGLECSVSCGECKGMTCSNCPSLPEEVILGLPETSEMTDMLDVTYEDL